MRRLQRRCKKQNEIQRHFKAWRMKIRKKHTESMTNSFMSDWRRMVREHTQMLFSNPSAIYQSLSVNQMFFVSTLLVLFVSTLLVFALYTFTGLVVMARVNRLLFCKQTCVSKLDYRPKTSDLLFSYFWPFGSFMPVNRR